MYTKHFSGTKQLLLKKKGKILSIGLFLTFHRLVTQSWLLTKSLACNWWPRNRHLVKGYRKIVLGECSQLDCANCMYSMSWFQGGAHPTGAHFGDFIQTITNTNHSGKFYSNRYCMRLYTFGKDSLSQYILKGTSCNVKVDSPRRRSAHVW